MVSYDSVTVNSYPVRRDREQTIAEICAVESINSEFLNIEHENAKAAVPVLIGLKGAV